LGVTKGEAEEFGSFELGLVGAFHVGLVPLDDVVILAKGSHCSQVDDAVTSHLLFNFLTSYLFLLV
jgi:hypothetical protein